MTVGASTTSPDNGHGNGFLIAIGALLAASLSLTASGYAGAWLTRATPPRGGPARSLLVLIRPGDPGAVLGSPGLNLVLFWWIIASLLLAACAALATLAWRVLRGRLNTPANARSHARSATGRRVREEAGERVF